MKTKLISLSAFLIMIIVGLNLKAQVLTVDPVMTAAIVSATTVESSNMKTMSDNQSKIIVMQTAVVGLVDRINGYQKATYNGLQFVSTAVKNSYQLVRCYKVLQSIYSYQSKMLNEASKNPLALIFAYKAEEQMVTKAITLYAEISTLILKENADYLMDSGDRTKLMFNVLTGLEVIEGFSAMAYYEVHRAVIEGIVNKLNPFKQFQNNDARLIREILNTWKF